MTALTFVRAPVSTAEDAPASPAKASRAVAMRSAATAFLDALDARRRGFAARPWKDAARTTWSGFPGRRIGISWRALSPAQRRAATALLRTGLGTRGLELVEEIRFLEAILRQQEAGRVRIDADWRHPELYVLAVFGTPSATSPWGWRLEGHHGSWNFSLKGERVAITPRFQGANPARVLQGPRKGLRVLGPEEDAARRLLQALTPAQRSKAVLSRRVPASLPPSGNPDLSRAARRGVPLGALSSAQQGLVWTLLETWARAFHPALAAAELARAKRSEPGQLHFAWMGAPEGSGDLYYRLHGPTLHLQFWRRGNHTHTVWRDPAGDFGR